MAVTVFIDGSSGIDVAYMGEFTAQTSDLTSRSMIGGTAGPGAEHPQRVLVGLVSWGSSSTRTLSSAGLLGITATIIQQASFPSGGVAIIAAEVPDDNPEVSYVTLTFSGITNSCQAALVRAVGLNSFTPTDSDAEADTTDAQASSVAIDVAEGGFVAAVGVRTEQGTGVTWTGATEQYDAAVESVRMTFAYSEGLSVETGRTIAMQVNATGEESAVAAATWR